jgi:hypothetical protein
VRPDSEFGILTTLRVERPGNRDLGPGTERGIFLSEEVQSGSGAHTYPYSIQPSRISPGKPRMGREAEYSPRL